MFTFTGTVTQNIYSSATIPVLDPNSGSYTFNISIAKPIVWTGQVPRELMGIGPGSLNSIVGPPRTISAIPTVSIVSGMQGWANNAGRSEPTVQIGINPAGTTENTKFQPSTGGQNAGTVNYAGLVATYTALTQEFLNDESTFQLFFNIWNECPDEPGQCSGFPGNLPGLERGQRTRSELDYLDS